MNISCSGSNEPNYVKVLVVVTRHPSIVHVDLDSHGTIKTIENKILHDNGTFYILIRN